MDAMVTIPDEAKALVDGPEFAVVATVEPSGQPQLSMVWIDRDGEDLVFSTVRGRRKTDNLERSPQVSVLIHPSDNPYQYLEVRGTAEVTDDPDGELIQRLAHKYTGAAYDGADPTKGRVVVRVKPHKVFWR